MKKEKSPLEKAQEAELRRDWEAAAHWYVEACKKEIDNDCSRAARYFVKAADAFQKIRNG